MAAPPPKQQLLFPILSPQPCRRFAEQPKDDGAIIVSRPADRVSGLTVYDRYVGGTASCNADEIAVLQEIKTVDVSMCAFFICKHAPMGNH